jgi:hypothetical protein
VCGDRGCPHDVATLAGNGEGAVCGVGPDFVSVLTLGDPVELAELYIWYGGREPGMQCDGPFTTDGYGVIREITGEAGVEAFVQLHPRPDDRRPRGSGAQRGMPYRMPRPPVPT